MSSNPARGSTSNLEVEPQKNHNDVRQSENHSRPEDKEAENKEQRRGKELSSGYQELSSSSDSLSAEDTKRPVDDSLSNRKKTKKTKLEVNDILNKAVNNPIWLSVSEAAKLGGVQNKTIRRAIQSKVIKYKVIGNRYLIDFASLVIYLHTTNKLKNKFKHFGIGQYVKNWRQ